MMITGKDLWDEFLTPEMHQYFERKLPNISEDDLKTRVEEALKFLNIAVYCRGNIPVSQEIDDIWHYWILQTRQYEQLCKRLHGRRFIHHSSNAYDDESSGPIEHHDIEQEVVMLATYALNYGPFQTSRIRYWPFANYLVTGLGMSREQLNDWLTSALDAPQ